MSFEKNLTLLRKKNNMSQEDLALAISVSRQTVYAWEAGLNSPNITMLQKISATLEASTDELINGYSVDRLPNKLGDVLFTYISDCGEEVIYEEIPNWYVPLKVGEDVCFALYDNGIKDFSYHVSVVNEIKVHRQKGFEIAVKEYDKKLEHTDTFSLIAKKEGNKILFIGRIFYQDGVKTIETYRDKCFLDKWGIEGKLDGTQLVFMSAKKYAMSYNGKNENVVGIAYFDTNKTYIEVYLNARRESLFWRRYELNRISSTTVRVDGREYGLFYEVATSRLMK